MVRISIGRLLGVFVAVGVAFVVMECGGPESFMARGGSSAGQAGSASIAGAAGGSGFAGTGGAAAAGGGGNIEISGAAGITGAAGTSAAGTGTAGGGAAGTGVTSTGAAGTGAARPGAAGTGGVVTGAAGRGTAGTGAAATGAAGTTGAAGQGGAAGSSARDGGTDGPVGCNCMLSVQYQCKQDGPMAGAAVFAVKVTNTGMTSIALNTLTVRYWYTVDGTGAQSGSCSSTGHPCTVTFQSTPAKPKADEYAVISFGGGMLAPGDDTGDVNVTINGNGPYTQTNDYSFVSTGANYIERNEVTAYVSGQLTAGLPP